MSLQTVAQEYLNSLWGNPALQYQVTPTTWQTPVTPGQSTTPTDSTNPQWGQGYSGSKTPDTREASNAEGSGRESFSMDKWAGQFSPSLSAKDVARAYGKFMRTIPLPAGVIADDIEAQYTDGILEISVRAPKASRDSAHIPVRRSLAGAHGSRS